MSKATEDKLNELHGAVADVLANALKNPGQEGVSAAMVAQAIAFLKANNINAGPNNPGIAKVQEALPFPAPGEDEGEPVTTFQRH